MLQFCELQLYHLQVAQTGAPKHMQITHPALSPRHRHTHVCVCTKSACATYFKVLFEHVCRGPHITNWRMHMDGCNFL